MKDLAKEILDAAVLADEKIGDILKRANDALPKHVLQMLNGTLIKKLATLQENITTDLSPEERQKLDIAINDFMKLTMFPGEESDCSTCEAAENCPIKGYREQIGVTGGR